MRTPGWWCVIEEAARWERVTVTSDWLMIGSMEA